MTGVLEVAAASAAIAAFSHTRREKERQEEKVASELYRRFFGAELIDCSPDRASFIQNLPTNLDANAAAAVRAIERYQKERRHWFLGLSSSSEHVGDTRTRVLEELKQWFLTVRGEAAQPATEVSARLDYAWQFLLRASAFESQNTISFLGTLGEVCRHLERLFQQTLAGQRTGEAKLGHILSLGRELVEGVLSCLVFSLIPCNSDVGLDSVPALGQLVSEAASSEAGSPSILNLGSHSGKILSALLQTEHVMRLGTSDEAAETVSPVLPSQGAMLGSGWRLADEFEETLRRWREPCIDSQSSGLLQVFCTPDRLEMRCAFIQVCVQLDRLCFFLGALHPYRRTAGVGGDASLCWLRRGLVHLLQELERSLAQLRQSRLQVMSGAKQHLQELSKKLPKVEEQELRWMQGLRHVDEPRLEQLHKQLTSSCAELISSASAARETELKAAAKESLKSIAASFASADFQSRCSLALPERLAAEMRELSAPA